MAYRTHSPKSRKYKKRDPNSKDHKSHLHSNSSIEEHDLPPIEPVSIKEKKSPQAFSFLTSLFGPSEKTEKSGKPLFNILDHDIYFDDLLLAALILVLLTDKVEDEILIIILVYLLLDIF